MPRAGLQFLQKESEGKNEGIEGNWKYIMCYKFDILAQKVGGL